MLSFTFSLYGFLKKKSNLSAESALLFEMLVWTLPVLGYFIYLAGQNQLVILTLNLGSIFYVFCAGFVTITPLWLFNTAVKSLDLGTVGFLQFLAPSLQLIVGVFLFKESFETERLISFGLIWIGIIIYSIESYSLRKKEV
jgi:chloramphenicol-sensitive protein RarD